MNWTVGMKIIAGFAIALAIIVIIGVVSYNSTTKLIETADSVAHSHSVLTKLEEVFSMMKDVHRGIRGYVITGEESFLEPYVTATGRIDSEIQEIRKLTADQPNHQRRLDLLEPIIQNANKVLQETVEIRRTQGLEAAIEEVKTAEGNNAMNDIRRIIDELEKEERTLLDRRAEEAETRANQTIYTIILGTLFSFLFLSLAGFFITRSITGPLTEGVNVLGSSASEILATTAQVASGAAQTGTAVTETATTVEEVKQTAQVSSQKAKYVSDSAQRATQVSQSGKKSVEQSIEAMNRIRQQMESVAESIVRLSEQSQAIGEIVAVVNDLAEQSNLLAVNAAIEAAKAGDQGRGFAVVAQEVKSLALQSKQATAQVRTILGDVQKAISTAVLATEQGSKAVETGVKQSGEAGDSIRILTDSIAEAAQAATQIAASSQQQLAGMDQVAMAMENIKQASMQNVTGTRQAEVAAQNLHALGLKLRRLIERSNSSS